MVADVRIDPMKSTMRLKRLRDEINELLALRLTYQLVKRKSVLADKVWELL